MRRSVQGCAGRNVQRFRGGLVFKAHRLCVSLNSRRVSNKEEEEYAGRECPLALLLFFITLDADPRRPEPRIE